MIALYQNLSDGVNCACMSVMKSVSQCVCSAGVPEADCSTTVHRQADWIPGGHAAARRTPGCSLAHHKLPEKVSADKAGHSSETFV